MLRIKTCLWKLSTTFIKFEEARLMPFMRVKCKRIISDTFYHDFLSLDTEMELKGLCFQHEKMKLPLYLWKYTYVFLHALLYLESAVSKSSPKSTKLV